MCVVILLPPNYLLRADIDINGAQVNIPLNLSRFLFWTGIWSPIWDCDAPFGAVLASVLATGSVFTFLALGPPAGLRVYDRFAFSWLRFPATATFGGGSALLEVGAVDRGRIVLELLGKPLEIGAIPLP